MGKKTPRRILRRLVSHLVLAGTILGGGGCSRGLFKGPEGQGERGLGLKVPVLNFFRKESYEPDNFAPDNFDAEQVNPFRTGEQPLTKEEREFSRYQEELESQ